MNYGHMDGGGVGHHDVPRMLCQPLDDALPDSGTKYAGSQDSIINGTSYVLRLAYGSNGVL